MRRAPCRPGRKRKSLGSAFAYHMVLTCVALPSKKKDISPTFCTNLPLEAPLPVYFSCIYDVPSFCHDSSHTSDPKMHHPVMDSLVLSLQCGKATAVFVSSRHRVSLKLENVVPGRWILSFSYILLWPSVFYCSSIDKQYSYARVFFEKSHDHETFFCSSTALTHSSVFLSTFLCLLRHVSSRLRRG